MTRDYWRLVIVHWIEWGLHWHSVNNGNINCKWKALAVSVYWQVEGNSLTSGAKGGGFLIQRHAMRRHSRALKMSDD